LHQFETGQIVILAEQIEHEKSDSFCFTPKILQQIEVRPAVIAHRDHFSVHNRAVRQFRQGFGDLWELPAERFSVA
jgi:hypothetical protein